MVEFAKLFGVYDTTDEHQLEILAEQLAARRFDLSGVTLALVGELGAGKTTFVRYFLRALGVAERVSSPSFVLEQIYHLPKVEKVAQSNSGSAGTSEVGPRQISHWDLYRVSGLPEELQDPAQAGELRLVEWAERGGEQFIKSCGAVIWFSYQSLFEPTIEGATHDGDRAGELLLLKRQVVISSGMDFLRGRFGELGK